MHATRFFAAAVLSFFLLTATGCADKLFSENGDSAATVDAAGAPTQEAAARQGKLRFPQSINKALSTGKMVAGKYGAQNANLFLAFAEYEADGVTRRVLDQYGVTRRILNEYGVTRRILSEYGVTRRILSEYGITRRVMDEYGGLTWDLLEAFGVTRRILDEYGVTRRVLQEYAETYEPAIDLRVRINRARPGISIVFVVDLLDTFIDEIADDTDIELIEPDVAFEGAPLYLREGFRQANQMVPWNLAKVGGVFTAYDKDAVDIFILDSGIYTRDLNVVEHKDFTMLFENRDEEMWDDSHVIDMPYFDPGETGDWTDGNGHGTHGAGTIGAKNNSEGTKGLAPEARIHSLKVLTNEGQTDITTVVSAIDYVTDFKQRNPLQPVVANLSLGMDLGSTAYNVFDEAVKRAIDFGVVVVVSAGNDGADASTYSPAHVYEAITVGAYDPNDRFADFSNHGPAVDILAPGDGVVSLTHLESEADNDDNVLLSGTSSSAPHVAAAAALYLAQHPDASPATVKQALINAAQPRIENVPQGTTNRSLWVDFADDGLTKEFEVTKAEWNSETKKFKVEGDGPRLDSVTLINVARGSEIATVVVNESGDWKYEVTEPAQMPCTVDASYLGGIRPAATTRHEVAFAPGSCDHTALVEKAEWKDGDQKLTIEGRAASGMTVSIQDARIGGELISLTADSKGEFVWIVENPAYVPCAVKAVSGGHESELTVEGADENDCSQGAGMSSAVTIDKAEYDPGKFKLTIEGDAKEDTDVTLYSTASGNAFATVTSNGSYKAQITNPSILPCTVKAVSEFDGSIAEHAVIDKVTKAAPKDCERSLTLETVKWSQTNQELELKGRGLYNGSVTFRNARSGEVVHTASISNQGKFDAKVSGLEHIPCSLIIESQETTLVTIESPIEDQAYNCDRNLLFNLLQYTGIYQRLSAGGFSTPGTTVSLTNLSDDAPIVDVLVADDGTWRADLDLSESGQPPCGVLATSANGTTQSASVTPLMGCVNAFVYVPVEEEIEQNAHSFVTIGKAAWNNDARTLYTEGTGYVNMEVIIRNPYNGKVLGTTQTSTDEKWNATASVPGTIPCLVEVELDGRLASMSVSNVPPNCYDQPFINVAEWKDGALTVRGVGGNNFEVTLSSAVRGLFATETFSGQGELAVSYTGSDLPWIPCTLEMTSNDMTVSLPVNGRPTYCDGKPVVLLSKWANGNLMLTAQGGFGAAVTVTDGRGADITSGAFDDNGMFSVALPPENLAYVPCSVEFTTDGMTASRTVESAPDWCDGQPVAVLAKWANGQLLLTANGGFRAPVTVTSAGTGETVTTGVFDNSGTFSVALGSSDLAYVPCSVIFTTDGMTASRTVDSAPDWCEGQPVAVLAKWANGQLLLTANGGFRAPVTVTSAGTGETVTTGVFDNSGTFSVALGSSDLAYVPCSVTFTTDGMSATRTVDGAPDACDGTPYINLAKWNAGSLLFTAEGALNGAVRLYSAATGALLYESTFGPTGEVEWVLNGDQGLPYVPANLRIDYQHRPGADFRTMTVPVVNAPAHVDGNVTIEKAEWKDGALLLVAFGPFDAALQLSSVGRDLPVGTASLDRLGELEASIATTFAPCTVRVAAGDHFAEALVVNAPVWCDAQAWLEFGKAAWDAGNMRVILEGEGYDGFGNGFAEVTFHGPDGTQAFSTTLDEGEWTVDLILSAGEQPPCTLEARIAASGDAFGGATPAFPVDGMCGN